MSSRTHSPVNLHRWPKYLRLGKGEMTHTVTTRNKNPPYPQRSYVILAVSLAKWMGKYSNIIYTIQYR